MGDLEEKGARLKQGKDSPKEKTFWPCNRMMDLGFRGTNFKKLAKNQ